MEAVAGWVISTPILGTVRQREGETSTKPIREAKAVFILRENGKSQAQFPIMTLVKEKTWKQSHNGVQGENIHGKRGGDA